MATILPSPLARQIDAALLKIPTPSSLTFSLPQHPQIQSLFLSRLPVEILRRIARHTVGGAMMSMALPCYDPSCTHDGMKLNIHHHGTECSLLTPYMPGACSSNRLAWDGLQSDKPTPDQDLVNLRWTAPWAHDWNEPHARVRYYPSTGDDLVYPVECRCAAMHTISVFQTCQHFYHLMRPIFYENTLFSIRLFEKHARGTALDFSITNDGLRQPAFHIPAWKFRYLQLYVDHELQDPMTIKTMAFSPFLRMTVMRARRLKQLSLRFFNLFRYPIVWPDWTLDPDFLHLLCRLDGLERFEFRKMAGHLADENQYYQQFGLLGQYPRVALEEGIVFDPKDIVSLEARTAWLIEKTLQSIICGNGPRRTLGEGVELDQRVAKANALFHAGIRDAVSFGVLPEVLKNASVWPVPSMDEV